MVLVLTLAYLGKFALVRITVHAMVSEAEAASNIYGATANVAATSGTDDGDHNDDSGSDSDSDIDRDSEYDGCGCGRKSVSPRGSGQDNAHYIDEGDDNDCDNDNDANQSGTLPSTGLYYRIHVKARPGVPPFGPLSPGSVHVLPERAAIAAIRLTAMHADRACSVLHEGQVSQSSWESRLMQIMRISERLGV